MYEHALQALAYAGYVLGPSMLYVVKSWYNATVCKKMVNVHIYVLFQCRFITMTMIMFMSK